MRAFACAAARTFLASFIIVHFQIAYGMHAKIAQPPTKRARTMHFATLIYSMIPEQKLEKGQHRETKSEFYVLLPWKNKCDQ